MTPDYDLLKHAYAIIDGIPDERFDLNDVSSNEVDRMEEANPNHCGTIACAIGWLAMHPDMQARGLSLSRYGDVLLEGGHVPFDLAAAQVFDIGVDEACALFSCVGNSRYDRTLVAATIPRAGRHKRLFQHRVKSFLREKGQL